MGISAGICIARGSHRARVAASNFFLKSTESQIANLQNSEAGGP